MELILFGAKGKMGTEIYDLICKTEDCSLVAGVDPAAGEKEAPLFVRYPDRIRKSADCILDFSLPCNTVQTLRFAVDRGIPLVIGTTGQSAEAESEIIKASKTIPVFRSVNYSCCLSLLKKILIYGGNILSPCETVIAEMHKRDKLDRPSGTAKVLAKMFYERFPAASLEIHSVRVGNCPGVHEILMSNGGETLTVRHEVHDRSVFAAGALKAARFLVGKAPGLYDSFEEEIR